MKDRDILLSVIVPVYNVEKYLRECLQSILDQNIPDMEVILIDDGSTDSSGKICDGFTALDNRVVVIHKENAGVSAARNSGLDIAKGKYIIFADSDDIIPKEAYQNLIMYAEEECLIMGGHQLMAENGDLHKQNVFLDNKISQKEFLKDLFEEKIFSYLGYPVDKIYCRKKIEQHHIRFNENIKLNEDRLFILQYMMYCDNVIFISPIVYYYRQRMNGVILETRRNSTVTDSEMTVIQSFDEMKKICLNYSKEMYFICARKAFESALDLLNRVNKKDVKKIKRLNVFLVQNSKICLFNPNITCMERIKIVGHTILRK